MTHLYNRYEGTDGAQISTSSLGDSGAAAATIVLNGAAVNGGNSTLVYDAASALEGNTAAKLTLQAGSSYIRFDDPAPGARGVLRIPVRWSATPSATALFGGILNGSDGWMTQIYVDTSNRISISSRTTIIVASRFTGTPGTLYWVEVAATKGATTTDGRVELYVYADDGTTLLHSYDSGATVDTTTADAARYRIGGATTASGLSTMVFDVTQCGTLATGLWGPLPAPGNPPVTVLSSSRSYAIIDATESTGDYALSYDIGLFSGGSTAGEAIEISEGKWIVPIPAEDDQDAIWQVIATDTVTQWTDTEIITIEKQQVVSDNSVPVRQFILNGGEWI